MGKHTCWILIRNLESLLLLGVKSSPSSSILSSSSSLVSLSDLPALPITPDLQAKVSKLASTSISDSALSLSSSSIESSNKSASNKEELSSVLLLLLEKGEWGGIIECEVEPLGDWEKLLCLLGPEVEVLDWEVEERKEFVEGESGIEGLLLLNLLFGNGLDNNELKSTCDLPLSELSESFSSSSSSSAAMMIFILESWPSSSSSSSIELLLLEDEIDPLFDLEEKVPPLVVLVLGWDPIEPEECKFSSRAAEEKNSLAGDNDIDSDDNEEIELWDGIEGNGKSGGVNGLKTVTTRTVGETLIVGEGDREIKLGVVDWAIDDGGFDQFDEFIGTRAGETYNPRPKKNTLVTQQQNFCT